MKRSLKTMLAMLLALMFMLTSTAFALNDVIIANEPTYEAGHGNVYFTPSLPLNGTLNYTINNLTGIMRLKLPNGNYAEDYVLGLYDSDSVLTLNAAGGAGINIGRPDGRRVDFSQPGTFLVNGYFTNAPGNNLIGENPVLDNAVAVRADNVIPSTANVYFRVAATIDTSGYGKVLMNGTTIESAGYYYARQRSNIQLIAVPEKGYVFKEWQFVNPAIQPTNVKLNKNYLNYDYINRNLIVTAVFEEEEIAADAPIVADTYFTVTYKYRNASGVWQSRHEAVLAGCDATNPNAFTVPEEVAISGSLYEFKGWSVENDYLNVTENRTITAQYDLVIVPPPPPVPAATPSPAPPVVTPPPVNVIVPFDPTTVDAPYVQKPVYVNPIRFVDCDTGLDIWALRLCKPGNAKSVKVVDTFGENVSVTYKITNTDYAKMVGKKVQGKKTGVTTLVATASDGRRAVIRLYVNTEIPNTPFGPSIDEYSATGLKLSLSSKTIKKGATHGLNVTLTPAYASQCYVVFSSNNPKVAKVTQTGFTTATVQGMKKGKATVTAEWISPDGELVLRKTCKYTVK